MKKNIYLALVSFVLSVVAISCNDDADMLFEETASERKIEALEQFTEALNASEQGWIFQYFPDDNQKYGGYTYVVKFEENDSVSVWFEGSPDLSMTQVSLYDVKSYGGPVLTFNTYNLFMHYFATPSSSEYNAKGGDYEFLLVSESDDIVELRGTKTGNNMRMTKLNDSPEAYLTKVNTNVTYLESGSFAAIVNGQRISVSESNRNFVFTYDEDGESVVLTVPYIITHTGISFYEEVNILEQSVKDFTLDIENNRLTSDSGDMYFDIFFPPINLNDKAWWLNVGDAANRSQQVYDTWVQAYISNSNTYSFLTLSSFMKMGEVSSADGDYGMSFYTLRADGSVGYRAHKNLAFNGVYDKPDYIDIVDLNSGNSWWQYFSHLSVMVDVITENSPYEVTVDDVNNPTQVRLVSVKNPDVWLVLNE